MKRRLKSKTSTENKNRGVNYVSHTINVLIPLDERIIRTMSLEGIANFTAWANSAFTDRCRATEQKHGVDSKGNPVVISAQNPPGR